LAGDNLTDAIKIALVAGDDSFPDLVEDMDVLECPIDLIGNKAAMV